MADVGAALHLCIARANVLGRVDADEVARILSNWHVSDSVDTAAVIAQLQAFNSWVEKRWPGCPVLVEVPVETDGPEGTRIRGRIDLLVDTPAGWTLLDHKANPGGSERDEDLAAEHGPQLLSYSRALESATGKAIAESWLYLPVGARAVRVT
jgi:ATP-dependent exoDNAse (exonuclease V) beta subunit